ncbi:hypothetical protein BH23ACT3_BH23ACT3_22150 [soil metagenome]
MSAAAVAGEPAVFDPSRDRFETVLGWLQSTEAGRLSHGELETRLADDARELFRQLLQDHLTLRAHNEPRVASVVAVDGSSRGTVETGHTRALATVFGPVEVARRAYRARQHSNLHPADAALNLPAEKHSHGLRRLAALEGARGSFDDTVEAIERGCGQSLGKRQVEDLAARGAVDFDDFYTTRRRSLCDVEDTLVLSCDGKGIVMLPDSLRDATRKAAATSTHKVPGRLSRGEKRGRKRMAEVGAVYDAAPAPRRPDQIMAPPDTAGDRAPPPSGPVAANKWLTASVVDNAATVVAAIFDEGDRRDPDHVRTWVALVDGNNHQIDRITTEAADRGIEVAIVIDFVHVLEYLWSAAWSFHDEGDPAAQRWVAAKATDVLAGHARKVATSIRRKATRDRLDPSRRANADRCARYLVNKADHLDYPTALASGWPIATGIIEGACRHLVKDRMDLTGARWSLTGAEAILKLRAIHSNGDFDDYWHYHLAQEHRRVHQSRYADGIIPQAA